MAECRPRHKHCADRDHSLHTTRHSDHFTTANCSVRVGRVLAFFVGERGNFFAEDVAGVAGVGRAACVCSPARSGEPSNSSMAAARRFRRCITSFARRSTSASSSRMRVSAAVGTSSPVKRDRHGVSSGGAAAVSRAPGESAASWPGALGLSGVAAATGAAMGAWLGTTRRSSVRAQGVGGSGSEAGTGECSSGGADTPQLLDSGVSEGTGKRLFGKAVRRSRSGETRRHCEGLESTRPA